MTLTLTGGKRPLGRHRCSWDDNIKMEHREKEWDDVDWIGLVQVKDG
jgi:hypothetical protein